MSNGNNNGHHRNGNGLVQANGNGHRPEAAVVTEHDPVSSAGHDLLWDGLPPVVTQALEQPLDPALVSQRKGRGGRTFFYIEGHTVYAQANRIFGRGGWGYDVEGDVTLREIETVDPNTGEVRRGQAYSAKVMVNVPGAPSRTDVGFHAVAEETVEGHETAYKGAVTDGVKRAMRSFGDQFGNCLYGDWPEASSSPRPERVPDRDNGGSHQNQPNRSAESQEDKLRNRLFELAAEQGFDEDGVRTAVEDKLGKSIDDLTAAELGPLVEGAANKVRQMKRAA